MILVKNSSGGKDVKIIQTVSLNILFVFLTATLIFLIQFVNNKYALLFSPWYKLFLETLTKGSVSMVQKGLKIKAS